MSFFAKNVIHIEIIRDGEIFKVYFPILPCCKLLPKEVKIEFHEDINYEDEKGKLTELMEKSDEIIEIMQHEEVIQNIY